jgi:hypothetical protein
MSNLYFTDFVFVRIVTLFIFHHLVHCDIHYILIKDFPFPSTIIKYFVNRFPIFRCITALFVLFLFVDFSSLITIIKLIIIIIE